jgi:hypothetical protein
MKLNKPWMLKIAGYLAACGTQALVATLDFKAVSCDPTTDPLHPECTQRYLYTTWHECVIVGLPLRAHCGMLGMASEHRDGELLNQSALTLGWKMIRGSTSHGSVSALKKLIGENDLHLKVAPDGPRGPRRKMAQGAVYLASKTGLPLVCCAYGFDRPWRLNSWDQCIIPKPFSRARAIYGPAIRIPSRISRMELAHYCSVVEQLMNQLTTEAEAWAESNKDRPRQYALKAGSIPRRVLKNPAQFCSELSPEATRLVDLLEQPYQADAPSESKAA